MYQITELESVWSYLKSQEQDFEDNDSSRGYGWLSMFCSFMGYHHHLPADLAREKNVLTQLAQRSFSHKDLMHTQMLVTLYHKLTGLVCPSPLGSHWEVVGFQGTDPASDFRAVGILGLLQPLALSLSNKTLKFILNVIELSHHSSQGFPFMVLSLNVTSMALNILKSGHLDRLIKQKASALEVMNLCYGAILYFIYDHWVKENVTLKESGLLLKKAETCFHKDVAACVKRFEQHVIDLQGNDRTLAVQLEEVQLYLSGHFSDNARPQ